MEFETILTEERDGVFIITFNRLEARNAINNLMTKELSDALDYWDKNDELRACVLTNNGHVFCAGSDLKELAEDAWEMPEGREKWGFAACTKRYFDKPLIAAVRGKALGGGVEIVEHAIWLLLPMNRSSACLSLVSALLPLVVARFFALLSRFR